MSHLSISQTKNKILVCNLIPRLELSLARCMDFMLCLLKTLRKHDSILAVVDCFSKIAHFLPCSLELSPVDASSVVKIFFYSVVKLHDLLTAIMSDKDVKS